MRWGSFLKSILISLVILQSVLPAQAQEDQPRVFPLKVKKGSYLRINDTLRYFSNDTILFIVNKYLNELPSQDDRSSVFYDSLKLKASRNRLANKIYDLVVVNPVSTEDRRQIRSAENGYTGFEGIEIRNITVERLDPFGRTIYQNGEGDAGGMGGFLNRTHVTTRELVIMNYLLFAEGDTISAFRLSESERLLRQLPFIYDARIIILPVDDKYSDIHIITKDVYSIGVAVSLDGLNAGKLDFFERNLFGIGHELILSLPYDYDKKYPTGFGMSYKASNISKSLIDGTLSYYNAFGYKFYDATFSRKFLTSLTRYAGGFSVRETYTTEDLDTLEVPEPLEYNYLDVWGGRSFLISDDHKTRLVLSARYINNNVFERPDITGNSYRSLQKYKLYLGSISLSTQEYFKTSLIYNYGRNEDIAIGWMFQLTGGKEFSEFKDRSYYGAEFSYGSINSSIGYLYVRTALSTFANQLATEQAMIKLQAKYISNLKARGKYKNRFFVDIDYTRGFYRYEDEYLAVGDKYGIRGYRNDSIRTNERLSISLESVSFSPINLYGFKFVFFGFTDLVTVGKNMSYSGLDRLISEIGIGIRIRNDNLIFNTFQLRIAYFPSPPEYSTMDYFNISGERLLKPPDFSPGAPLIYPYR